MAASILLPPWFSPKGHGSGNGYNSRTGFTLIELVVGVFLFALVSGGIFQLIMSRVSRLSYDMDERASATALADGLMVMTLELRSALSVSPFLSGANTNATVCSASIKIEPYYVSFIRTFADASVSEGRRSVVVGYRYLPEKKTIVRGEIPLPSVSSCASVSDDPTVSAGASTLITDVHQWDSENNGSLDPVFEDNRPFVVVRLARLVKAHAGENVGVTRGVESRIWVKSWQ